MTVYIGLVLSLILGGLVLFWLVQTRSVEVVRYEVIEADGEIEIRSYPSLVVAEVVRTGSRDQAVRSGFGPLARYIFAREREGEKIAMTAPVTQTPEGTSWTIRFVMPAGYTLSRLPESSDPDVKLLELPPARRAAIRFSGWWSDDLFSRKDGELRSWLQMRGLTAAGSPTFAYYNDPFTPGFMRRNEILYDLEP